MRCPAAKSLVVCLCALTVVTAAFARKRAALPKWDWSLSAALGINYDDNVLGFSESDCDRFLSDPATFPTPLESVDDLEMSVSLRPGLRWRAPQRLMVAGDYRFRAVHRLRNEFSDYQSHIASVSVRPRVTGYRWMVRARVQAIPSYYLRAYRDRDYNAYHATRYSNWDYAMALRYRAVSSLWLETAASYGSYYYNRKFTEYDSEYRDVTLGAQYETSWEARISASYTRRLSDNVGSRQTGALSAVAGSPLEDSEYGDADYHEDDVAAVLRLPVPGLITVPTDVSLGYRHRRRVYVTGRSLSDDPFHRGRLDNRGQWTLAVSAAPSPRWSLEGAFSHEARVSDSKEPAVPRSKNFTRNEFGVTVSYTIR